MSIDELTPPLLAHPALIWIDIDRADPAGLERCAERFDLHDLAAERALLDKERAQINIYDDMLFLDFYGLRLIDGPVHVELNEISTFVGEQFIITVRSDMLPAIDHIRERWQSQHRKMQHPTVSLLLYTLLDQIVGDYFPMVDAIGEQIETLEDRLMEERAEQPLQEIHWIRKQLFHFRRVIGPQREVLNALVRRDMPMLDEDILVCIADVRDHLLRVLDWLDSFRDMLTTLFKVQTGMESQRVDQIVRELPASPIMLTVASLIAGIYGMNFDHMPELHWLLGYPFALSMMTAASVPLFIVLRKQEWFWAFAIPPPRVLPCLGRTPGDVGSTQMCRARNAR